MTSSHETAILAGGYFWGMQDLLAQPGVISTVSAVGGNVLEPRLCNLEKQRP